MENLRDVRDKTINKEYVSWLQVDKFINSLKDFILSNNFNGVYGAPRGGLIFAVMISHVYNLPFLGAPQTGCLVVDDIVDSGVTALAWKDKGYKIASMYYKENKYVKPDFYIKEKHDEWLCFPWEAIPTNEDIDYATDTINAAINEAYPIYSSDSYIKAHDICVHCLDIIEGSCND